MIMPRLSGIELKTLFGRTVDKENDSVFFNDAEHLYLDKLSGERYISATQLIHNYSNPFNAAFFSKYKALEALADPDHFDLVKQGLLATQTWNPALLKTLNVDPEAFEEKTNEFLKSWDDTRDEACNHGTYVHEIMEKSFYGNTHFDLSNFGCPQICGDYTCIKGNYHLDLENGIYPEFLMSYITPEGLHIAGQADLVVKNGNDISILDWKTNKEIKKRSFFNRTKKKNVMMKFPLTNIEDCNFWHYTLQLSLYAYMLQQLNPDFNIKELKIVHIARDGKQTVYDLEYRKSDIERMLKHYAKELKTKELLELDKPYII